MGLETQKKTNRILLMYYYIIFLPGGFPIKDVAEQKGYSIGYCTQAVTYMHHADINNIFPLIFMLSGVKV